MLDGYGLHQLTWDACDERFGDVLVASPADSGGRGISLAVREGGAAADLTGATVYFMWKHKVTGERGTEPFTAVDASAGKFKVYYPSAMQEAEGAVQAQVMVSRGDDTYISSRVFTIRVEPVVIGGEEHKDGFTLFVDAINAYEHATEVTTDAATAANAAAALADTARENLTAAAERGDFDGADGVDGFSPTATVTQTEGGCTITIIDKNGTTTADVAKGAKGDKAIRVTSGRKVPRATLASRVRRVSRERLALKVLRAMLAKPALKDYRASRERRVPRALLVPRVPRARKATQARLEPKGRRATQATRGHKGATGPAGADGVSCTHSWNGSVLTVTSASGTSSADLRGPQDIQGIQGETGPRGETGPQGETGATGATGPQGPKATRATTALTRPSPVRARPWMRAPARHR